MAEFAPITLAGEQLVLLAERAIFWPSAETLLLADAHLGKAAHFRKNGLALPQGPFEADLHRVQSIVNRWQPKRIMYLGDLFHSAPNREWDVFAHWVTTTQLTHTLVQGNHDSYLANHAITNQLQVVDELVDGPFIFSHEPLAALPEGKYNLCGHLHPGVLLSGKAGQRLKLPCYWLAETVGILPAFGNLTGSVRLKGKAQVYAIANQQIFKV